ncbi:hypothetical protein M885DRAFT_612142, partial [Pelagophyceae sp. CCMP2097]
CVASCHASCVAAGDPEEQRPRRDSGLTRLRPFAQALCGRRHGAATRVGQPRRPARSGRGRAECRGRADRGRGGRRAAAGGPAVLREVAERRLRHRLGRLPHAHPVDAKGRDARRAPRRARGVLRGAGHGGVRGAAARRRREQGRRGGRLALGRAAAVVAPGLRLL